MKYVYYISKKDIDNIKAEFLYVHTSCNQPKVKSRTIRRYNARFEL